MSYILVEVQHLGNFELGKNSKPDREKLVEEISVPLSPKAHKDNFVYIMHDSKTSFHARILD